jgi:hypothetical protein
MTRLSGSLSQVSIGHIVRCADALTMIKPALLVVTSFLIATLLFAAGASMAQTSYVITMLAGILASCIAAAGVSGAGVLLMDRAREIELRSLVNAGVFGFMCLVKASLLGLIYFLIFLAVTVVAALLFFLCKLPGIGPLLLAVTFPPVALTLGVMIFSMFVVVIPLTLPALWEGKSVTETLSVVLAAIKERLIMVVLSFLLLYAICAVVGGVIAAVFLGGMSSTLALATQVIGFQSFGFDLGNLLGSLLASVGGMGGGFGYAGGGSGYVVALSLDSALMLAAVVALLSQVWMMGINLVYLTAVDGLDTAGAQQAIREGIEKTKQKAEEMKRHAQEAAAHARQAAEGARSASAAPAVSDVLHCLSCNGVVRVGAAFCGHCGHTLR